MRRPGHALDTAVAGQSAHNQQLERTLAIAQGVDEVLAEWTLAQVSDTWRSCIDSAPAGLPA